MDIFNIVGSLFKIKKIISIACDSMINVPNAQSVRYVLYNVSTYYSSTGKPFTNKVILFNAIDFMVLDSQELIKYNVNPNNVNKLNYVARIMLTTQDPTISVPTQYATTLNLVLDISTSTDSLQTWIIYSGQNNLLEDSL